MTQTEKMLQFNHPPALRFRGAHTSRRGAKQTANRQRGVFENPERATQSLLGRVMPEKIANATTSRWVLTIGFSGNGKTNRFLREIRVSASRRPFSDASVCCGKKAAPPRPASGRVLHAACLRRIARRHSAGEEAVAIGKRSLAAHVTAFTVARSGATLDELRERARRSGAAAFEDFGRLFAEACGVFA